MGTMKKALRMCIPVLCVLALSAGPAGAWILVDGDFNASADSADLRANSPGQDWYESRGDLQTLLTLNTDNIGGNSTKKAALLNYGIARNAYLTQEFSPAQTGRFMVGFDIYIDRIENSGNYDRTGHVFIGNDSITGNAPTGTGAERFICLAFYDPTPGTTGNDIQLRSITNSAPTGMWANTSQWYRIGGTGLTFSYDTWYSIMLDINFPDKIYDVYVNNALVATGVAGTRASTGNALEYISFIADSDARGDFYVDNVVPIPPAAWLLGSGLLGLVALRRRMKK